MNCIDSTFVSSVGEYVNQFEEDIACITGARYAIAVVNGTNALQVALRLAGVKTEEEVITQAFSFVATANAISYLGAKPVFIDVDRQRMGMSAEALRSFLQESTERKNGQVFNKKTGRRIAAIVPMHTFGFAAEIDSLVSIAKEWGIPLVEDAAESLGTTYKGKHTGTFGLFGTMSFNGNKIVTCGGGGVIITDSEELAKKAKHLTTTAKVPHKWAYEHDMMGYNFRMPNLNAALACAQLEMLDEFLASKKKQADQYSNFFSQTEDYSFIGEQENSSSNFWLMTIILSDKTHRDKFLKETNEAGVMTRPAWNLLNTLDMYRDCQSDDLLNSNWLFERVVNVPSSVV